VQDSIDWNNKFDSIFQSEQEKGIARSKLLSIPARDRDHLAKFSDAAICSVLLPGAGKEVFGLRFMLAQGVYIPCKFSHDCSLLSFATLGSLMLSWKAPQYQLVDFLLRNVYLRAS